MPVIFEPRKRLEHLEDYIRKVNLNLPVEEARIQLLRCRLVAYGLVAEINEETINRGYVDQLFTLAYIKVSETAGRDIADPYRDPCASQYIMLDELRSYLQRDPAEPFIKFVSAEFKKVFVPTLRLMTDLCESQNKYSWDEAKAQLQEVMSGLYVDVTWEECEERLERYLKKIEKVIKK